MIRIGTSGYSYPEWWGLFYPDKMPTTKMLPYYGERLNTVEINYTFRSMPSENAIANWMRQVPDGFAFTLKAPEAITHRRRLQDCQPSLDLFVTRARLLGEKRGVLYFQLPPTFKKDLERLTDFLALIPSDIRAAFEFRHTSWHADDVYDALRAHNTALCLADDGESSTPIVATADFGYLRLRDEGYGAPDLERWAQVVKDHQPAWTDTYVYFKHEASGSGPEFARQFKEILFPE